MNVKIVYGNPTRYYLDGLEVSEEVYRQTSTSRLEEVLESGQAPACPGEGWPIKSMSLGVHPKQRAQAEAYARLRGVPTEFSNDKHMAKPILRSPEHQRAYAKLRGCHDQSDYVGKMTASETREYKRQREIG